MKTRETKCENGCWFTKFTNTETGKSEKHFWTANESAAEFNSRMEREFAKFN